MTDLGTAPLNVVDKSAIIDLSTALGGVAFPKDGNPKSFITRKGRKSYGGVPGTGNKLLDSSFVSKDKLSGIVLKADWGDLESAVLSIDSSTRVKLYSELSDSAKLRILPLLASDEFTKILKVAKKNPFPGDSLTPYMQPAYSTLVAYSDWTIADFRRTYAEVKASGDLSSHGPVWVTDWRTNRLIGFIDLPTASVLEEEDSIGQRMQRLETSDVALLTDSRKTWLENVRQWDDKRKLRSVPVSMPDGFFLGSVFDSELVKIADAERFRTAALQTGISPNNTPYIKSPFWLLISKRLFWLLILIGIEVGAGTVISAFNDTLEKQIILSFFIPVTLAAGGNAGTQAAVVLIQAFAEGSLKMTFSDFLKALVRELIVGSADGIIVGLVLFGVAWWKGGALIAYTILVGLFTVVLLADLCGLFLPYLLKMCRIDPAVATSSIITALLDVVGLAILFSYAVKILDFS